MAVDPYSPCPCGSGKKLKFCCSDLAVDIEKVHKMIAGEQPHAALKHVEQLLTRRPDRASLLDLRASIEFSMHDFDAARQTIDTYLAAHSDSATAHAQHAIVSAATGNASLAATSLQSALELLGNDIPQRVLEAIGAVGHSLLLEGQLIAARAHLLLYAAIAPADDDRPLELLMRMNLQSGLPLLVREYLQLAECPADVPWRANFEEAARFTSRGLWRRAESVLSRLRSEVGAEPGIVYNLAVVHGWLGDTDAFAAGLHEFAQLDVPQLDAAEAEALAQLVDPHLEDPQMETVKLVYTLRDVDPLADCLRSDKRVEDYPLESPESDAEEKIRPRSTHVLLDRPTPATGVGIAPADIPHVIAFLSVYGKRTNRDAQLEVTTDRGEALETVQRMLKEIAGESLGTFAAEEVVAKKSISEESLSWRWRLPDDTPAQQRRTLLADERRQAILQGWTAAPRAALKNKSPQEAADDAALKIPLLASALIIEQAAVDPSEMPLFAELRSQLKLPPSDSINPQGLDLAQLPLVRIPYLQLADLADDQLVMLLNRAVLMGANIATLILARALAERTDLADESDLATAYRQLIRLELNYEVAQEWVTKARLWSKQRNKSVAEWALLELELSIDRGDAGGIQTVISEIREELLNEPGVAEATYRLLQAAGLVAPEQAQSAPRPVGASPAARAEPSALWTPGSDTSPSSTAEQGARESAIWRP